MDKTPNPFYDLHIRCWPCLIMKYHVGVYGLVLAYCKKYEYNKINS